MSTPTEAEVRAHLETEARIADRGAAVAREVGMSDLAHARLASIYRSALALLDAAREDKERLDWCEGRSFDVIAIDAANGHPAQTCIVGHWSDVSAQTFRAAIDQARGA